MGCSIEVVCALKESEGFEEECVMSVSVSCVVDIQPINIHLQSCAKVITMSKGGEAIEVGRMEMPLI